MVILIGIKAVTNHKEENEWIDALVAESSDG